MATPSLFPLLLKAASGIGTLIADFIEVDLVADPEVILEADIDVTVEPPVEVTVEPEVTVEVDT